jgi:hypothetical protein
MKIDTSFDLQTDLKDNLRTDMSVVDMQTDDILILIDSNFAAAEEKAIVDAKIMTKSRNDLDSNFPLKIQRHSHRTSRKRHSFETNRSI